jgi:hypothetical protein
MSVVLLSASSVEEVIRHIQTVQLRVGDNFTISTAFNRGWGNVEFTNVGTVDVAEVQTFRLTVSGEMIGEVVANAIGITLYERGSRINREDWNKVGHSLTTYAGLTRITVTGGHVSRVTFEEWGALTAP